MNFAGSGLDDGATSVGERSAAMAHSLYDGVRAKIRHLQSELEGRDAALADLRRDLEAHQRDSRSAVADADARQQVFD